MDKRTNTVSKKAAGSAAHKSAQHKAPVKKNNFKAEKKDSLMSPILYVLLGGLAVIILFAILQSKGCFSSPTNNFRVDEGVGALNSGESIPDAVLPAVDARADFRITEVQSSNDSIIQDDLGAYADWIEITNVSDTEQDLLGWKLAESPDTLTKIFTFPHHVLKPGERVLVFCTGTSRNIEGYTYHAPFGIARSGDSLILFNSYGSAVQTLNIPEMSSNQSYAEIDGSFTVTNEPTPLLENTSENYIAYISQQKVEDSPILLTELMAKNCSYAPDENNEYCDWIELYNSSSNTISLKGYCLSDSSNNLRKWTFPNITIGPGEYLLVYCSGYDRTEPGSPLHTNFRLSTEKEGVILTNSSGSIIAKVEYDLLSADQSYSLQGDGTWTSALPPTPGKANTYESAALISGQFAAQNPYGVIINEVMATTTKAVTGKESYDWVELYNSSSVPVDLSLWGLSDNPAKPRKWQFPEGTVIQPGAYLGIYLSGQNGKINGQLHAAFSLSSTQGETVVLSDPAGNILDRCPLGIQYSDVSYGRTGNKSGFYYLTAATPGSVNVSTGYLEHMHSPVFSAAGGLYAAGETVRLTLTCEPGAVIYYTLDSSEPDPEKVGTSTYKVDPQFTPYVSGTTTTYKYTGPITLSETTVVRAISVKNGQLPSLTETQTYFFGVNHTMKVVSLVVDPEDLWSYTKGIYVMGPNATSEFPYGSAGRGANYWMDWEKAANVELFGLEGNTILSQGCGIKIQGQFSRTEKQKSLKIIARSRYGSNRFYANLFPNRDYTEYQSFVLRQSGQDFKYTRMRDSILTSLAAGMGVMYQDTDLVIVYLNGLYWGHYNLRERINTYSICQWEGWDPAIKDGIDLLKANDSVMQGSNSNWKEFKTWYSKNGIATSEKLEYARKYIDVENYLNYIAVEMFTGNTDLLNCKKYRSEDTDGKWRWILFDFDWAFYTDTNSVGRWLKPGGVGEGNKCDNSLFIALMENSYCRDYFLSLFAEKLASDWSSEHVLQLIDERYELLEPELGQTFDKWGMSESEYNNGLKKFRNYAKTRPGRLLYFFSNALSKPEFEKYFGELARSIDLIDDKGKSFSYYK